VYHRATSPPGFAAHSMRTGKIRLENREPSIRAFCHTVQVSRSVMDSWIHAIVPLVSTGRPAAKPKLSVPLGC
jgi:hypothetical protein